MKILLIAPSSNMGKFIPETPSRALLILGTLAKQRGHQVLIAHQDFWSGKVEDEIKLAEPDMGLMPAASSERQRFSNYPSVTGALALEITTSAGRMTRSERL